MDSADQDQTAQNVQSDLYSALSALLSPVKIITELFLRSCAPSGWLSGERIENTPAKRSPETGIELSTTRS